MAREYQLMTDSSSDLPVEYLESEDILSMPLSFSIDGKRYYSGDMEPTEFYKKMREGAMPVTSQVNVDEATSAFESVLRAGRDILYIAFTSALSGTYHSCCIAASELAHKYPEQRIVIIDSLSVTLGQGLLVHLTNEVKKAGATIEKAAVWAREQIQHLSVFVCVNDLAHLHRGGRISKASTILGSLLGIQPILAMNDTGEIKLIGTKRGRKNTLNSLVDHMTKVIGDTVSHICYIAHADCESDALYVKERAKDLLGATEFLITHAGPVLGAHAGPGAVALCMLSDHRW